MRVEEWFLDLDHIRPVRFDSISEKSTSSGSNKNRLFVGLIILSNIITNERKQQQNVAFNEEVEGRPRKTKSTTITNKLLRVMKTRKKNKNKTRTKERRIKDDWTRTKLRGRRGRRVRGWSWFDLDLVDTTTRWRRCLSAYLIIKIIICAVAAVSVCVCVRCVFWLDY